MHYHRKIRTDNPKSDPRKPVANLKEPGNGGRFLTTLMPTYEYECETCGHHFEVFQSMKDAKLTDCPQDSCEGSVRRLLGTGAGVIFKGSGFYETDYRSDSYKAGAKKAEEGAKASSESTTKSDSGGGSSESKPAPAKESPAAPKSDASKA